MNPRTLLLMGLLSFLFACFSGSGYRKKGGRWFYGSVPMGTMTEELRPLNKWFARSGEHAYYQADLIAEADGNTFQGLSNHYAKDREHAFYCDTYRDGQDYFTTKRYRCTVIREADAGSFRALDNFYARDSSRLFHNGSFFPVQDPATFEVLFGNFARDRVTGYYFREPVPGSEGATFTALDDHYARDARQVYHGALDHGSDSIGSRMVIAPIAGADPASFTVLDIGYGKDRANAYWRGKAITGDVATFQVLGIGYAKTATQVFYEGELLPEADAASFRMMERPNENAFAEDARATYLSARRTERP